MRSAAYTSFSLLGPDNSLFCGEKIPVPSSRDFDRQATDISAKIPPKKSPKRSFSCKIPAKIPVSRDLLPVSGARPVSGVASRG
jgi:hypothetical protein